MPFVGVSLGAEPALRRMRTPFVPAQCTVTLVELAVAARYVTSFTVPHAVAFGCATANHMYVFWLLVPLLTDASAPTVKLLAPRAVMVVVLAAVAVVNRLVVTGAEAGLVAVGLVAVLAHRRTNTHAGVAPLRLAVIGCEVPLPVYIPETNFPVTLAQTT